MNSEVDGDWRSWEVAKIHFMRWGGCGVETGGKLWWEGRVGAEKIEEEASGVGGYMHMGNF